MRPAYRTCGTKIAAMFVALLSFGSVPPAPAQPDSGLNLRDGSHDFDFDFGTWKMHIRRLLHPLTGSTTWYGMEGITVVEPVWHGKANLATVEADGPHGHLELLALRLYDPKAHQWSINFATSPVGTLSVPCIGEFKNGRGVFYDSEPYNGRNILVRFRIWSLSATAAHSDQAFSDDGGKTWEINWTNDYRRIN